MSTFQVKNGSAYTDSVIIYTSGNISSQTSVAISDSIAIGTSNNANASSAVFGFGNIANIYGFAVGQSTKAIGTRNFAGGNTMNVSGTTNFGVSTTSTIRSSVTTSAILGGRLHEISGATNYSGIFVGDNNIISDSSTGVIVGGTGNYIIRGANSGTFSSENSFLYDNYSSAVLAGSGNIIHSGGTTSSIIAGSSNIIQSGANICVIIGGGLNVITGVTPTNTAIINSSNSVASGNSITILNSTGITISENNITYIGGIRRGGYVVSSTLSAASSNSSNTSYTTIAQFTAVAGAVYKIRFIGTYQTAATTTGIKVRMAGTATANVAGYMEGAISALAIASGLRFPISSMTSELITTGVSAINTPHSIEGEIIVRCTAGGSCRLEFASEVNASACQLNAGTTMLVERIDQ